MKLSSAVKKLTLMMSLLLVTYIPTFIWMWDRWFEKESYYGHGFLIPLVSLYIAWQRREALRRAMDDHCARTKDQGRRKPKEESMVHGPRSTDYEGRGRHVGLVIIAIALIIHIACAALKLYFISGFTFVFALYGAILFTFGKKMVRSLTFPIFFLLAMIPLPLVFIGGLTVKLKLFAAQAATLVLNNIGFSALRQGSIIRMHNSIVMVEAPCSGLRSLISLLTLGLIFSYAMKVSYVKKCTLFLSSIPIAIVTNIVRILLLCVVTELYGEKAAMGFFHDFTGYVAFAVAFFLLAGARQLLEGDRSQEAHS